MNLDWFFQRESRAAPWYDILLLVLYDCWYLHLPSKGRAVNWIELGMDFGIGNAIGIGIGLWDLDMNMDMDHLCLLWAWTGSSRSLSTYMTEPTRLTIRCQGQDEVFDQLDWIVFFLFLSFFSSLSVHDAFCFTFEYISTSIVYHSASCWQWMKQPF